MTTRSVNDILQDDKMLSKVNQKWTDYEPFYISSTESTIVLECETRLGLPEYFLISVKTDSTNNFFSEKDLYSEITRLRMRIFHKDNKLFEVSSGRDLFESTRRNVHKYSKFGELPSVLFFHINDLGSMDRKILPPDRERLVFEFTVFTRKNAYNHTQSSTLEVVMLRNKYLVGDSNRIEFVRP